MARIEIAASGLFAERLERRLLAGLDLVQRLRDRAVTSETNARTYEASGYHGEAFAARERAKAFRLAAEDAATILEVTEGSP